MSLLMENAYAKLGCGDPGDPIEFGALFTGSQILQRTPTVTGNRRLACASFWLKRLGKETGCLFGRTETLSSDSDFLYVALLADSGLRIDAHTGTASNGKVQTKSKYRGTASHTHLHIVLDLDNPDEAERAVLKKDLVRQELDVTTVMQLAANLWVNVAGIPFHIGANSGYGGADNFLKAILSDFAWFDGFAPDATEFAYLNAYGQCRPKRFAGKGGGVDVYGVNGFHHDYADQGDMGKDVSGCGNHMTVVGSLEQVTDTPTSNDHILIPGDVTVSLSGTYSNGNRTTTALSGTSSFFHTLSTILPKSGVWKWEQEIEADGGSFYPGYGVAKSEDEFVVRYRTSPSDTHTYINNVPTSFGTTNAVAGERFGFEFDADALTLKIFRGGTLETSHSLTPGDWRIAQRERASSSSTLIVDPSQFAHPEVFSGAAQALSSENIPCPIILDPSRYYQREQLIGGADLDLNWNPLTNDTIVFSGRIDSAQEFRVNMIIGGVQVNPFNTAGVGGEIVGEDGLTFHSGGATVGAATEYQGTCRHRAIRCTPTSGMALVTINHVNGTPTIVDHTAGGVAEEITFFPVGGGDRREYHKAIGGDAYRRVNGPGVTADSGFITGNIHNRFVADGSLPSGRYHVWVKRSVAQFSAAFTYEGNNSATDGTFMPFDFEPALLMGRRLSSPGDYFIKDNLSANPNTEIIRLDSTSGVGGPDWDIDFYSNGAKWFDATNTTTNYGGTYAGFAIAKTPIKFANEV